MPRQGKYGDALVVWLPRESIRDNLPEIFAKTGHGKCRVIIDCSEVFIERPKSLLNRPSTWSDYKRHNTIKFIVITRSGYISFLSDCYGGRSSDTLRGLNFARIKFCGFRGSRKRAVSKPQEIDLFLAILKLWEDSMFGDAVHLVNKNRQIRLRKPAALPLEEDVKMLSNHVKGRMKALLNDPFLLFYSHAYVHMK